MFNVVAHSLNINGRPLPMTKFPCGVIYFEQMSKEAKRKVVVVHNNYVYGLPIKVKVITYFIHLFGGGEPYYSVYILFANYK